MCGLVGGFWRQAPGNLEARLGAALSSLRHRGPNDHGYEVFRHPEHTTVLGQTRLSVIDLSAGGHQPMFSEDGALVIVFNGEIYNYRELRETLRARGRRFQTESDTEVLLGAWMEWGKACLPQLEGMFAFVILDKRKNRLTCVRDAFGIKPFFYERTDSSFVFASELQALLRLSATPPRADLQRSYDYLVHADYDSSEHTFIAGVKHLPPGMLLEIDLAAKSPSEPTTWWRPSIEEGDPLSFEDAAAAVRERFLQNVKLHLRSEVPLGAALSGGIDSSAVVCAMRHIEPDRPIHTFSFVAAGSDVSEERWVDQVNALTGATAHKVRASAGELAQDIDRLIAVQGEPFSSTSIYAQYRVFQTAKEHGMTVTLDGQGADELLAGYHGYPGQRLLSLFEGGHYAGMQAFARNWGTWPGRSYARAWMWLGRTVLPDAYYAAARHALGREFRSDWLKTDLLREHGVTLQEAQPLLGANGRKRRVKEQLAHALQRRGLPTLLRHGDRNSMAFSIESRVPFLTIGMASLLLSLPESYLISNSGETKSVFRAAMRGIVPDAILDRRDKIGFATPEKDWLQEMAPLARQWLDAADAVPFLNREALLATFDRATARKIPFSFQLWRWINYVRWYQLMGIDGRQSLESFSTIWRRKEADGRI